MHINKPIYHRVLLKLSGEILQGKENFGIEANVLEYIAKEIQQLIKLNIEVAIVIGGGNIFRGIGLEKIGMNRVVGDHIGMLATVINGLAIRDVLQRSYINAKLMSAMPLNGVCDNYNWTDAISLLRHGEVVIFSAGTGNPFFTTDSAACLRGIEINADVILKGTKVDGVYSADPYKNNDAILYKKLTYNQVLEKELKVMDLAAFTLARDHDLPIIIFNINKPNILYNIVMGNNEGTLIAHN
uniref:Uridylate kinase n=1 Tax=Candidatus Aschnera chinzeii TaxID=1485666 RepID=A0AAT9G401_9ENTR|nr:MAG: UMP kinase [Candidatus Aschnera chinzeii]